MDLRDEYRALYEAEHARRAELNSAMDRPITIITAMIGALYFSFSGIKAPAHPLHVIQTILGIVAAGLLVDAIRNLICSFYKNPYAFVCTAAQLEEHRRKLAAYLAATKQEADVDTKIKDLLLQQYIEAASKNAVVNETRTYHLHRAKTSIIWLLVVVSCVALIRLIADVDFAAWFSSMDRFFK